MMAEQPRDSAIPGYFTLNDHPLRALLSTEMHGRKLPAISTPAQILQVVILMDPDQQRAENDLMTRRWPSSIGDREKRFHLDIVGEVHVIWERHTEFSSYMLIANKAADKPFGTEAFDAFPGNWFSQIPGQVVRATQISVIDDIDPDTVQEHFLSHDLVHCDVMNGKIRLWSDFHLKSNGFGRLLVSNRGASAKELSLTLQRLQELGNYRNLALLGLPVAQTFGREISKLEDRLTGITQSIAQSSSGDSELLKELSELSSAIAQIRGASQYRMSATRAYAEMVEDRLRALNTRSIAGYESLTDFTERRLRPAARTCLSFASRLDAISQSAAWASDLLRTRVDTDLSVQNRNLLRTMSRRTGIQLRMQQTVEGLSVVAISYYATSLASYALKGIEPLLTIRHDLAVAAAILPIAALTWFSMRKIRSKLHG